MQDNTNGETQNTEPIETAPSLLHILRLQQQHHVDGDILIVRSRPHPQRPLVVIESLFRYSPSRSFRFLPFVVALLPLLVLSAPPVARHSMDPTDEIADFARRYLQARLVAALALAAALGRRFAVDGEYGEQ